MNRGVLQSSPVQQLTAASGPNWWNINSNMRPAPPPPSQLISHPNFLAPPPPNNLFPQYAPLPSSSSPPPSWHDHIQELPESWSQILMGGLVVEDQGKSGLNHIQHQAKKFENWEEQLLHHHHQQPPNGANSVVHVKQDNSANSYNHQVFGTHGNNNAELIQAAAATKPSWPQMMPVSSPKSCVTSLSSNMLDFSHNKADGRHPPPDRSSECNSTATGGAAKKARVQPSPSTQSSTFKVRKEKLGDRITALHQIVSPFGKTDTASVLLEAIGYIRFLQSQIEALSLPYLGSGSGNNTRHQQSVQGERNCLFPEDPGQLLNDNNCMKRKVALEQECDEEGKKDLRSRGLCLVPISCTVQVGSENGADYWAPAAIGGGFQ